MALRTADEYKQGLQDGRRVFLAGSPVPDVTEDPYIKVGVETAYKERARKVVGL